jgi:hypothetical protein
MTGQFYFCSDLSQNFIVLALINLFVKEFKALIKTPFFE